MKPILKFAACIFYLWLIIFISCKKEFSCEGCRGDNKPPTAKAGPDQVITLPTDSISLDGSASSDPDGTISVWLWKKISGPASFTFKNDTAAKAVVKNLAVGTYQFELKVTDNGGLSARDTMRVIVDSVVTTNHPPAANAGADQIITLPINNINLDGGGSTDPENNITGYQWTKISGPSSFNLSNTSSVQTQVTNLVQGVYQFELKVTDAGGLFSKDTMQVIVNAAASNNLPPVARAGNDTIIQSNQTSCAPVAITITLNGSNSYDPDGTIISYLWTGPGNIINPSSAISTVTDISGSNTFILKVTDNNGAFAFDTVQISILPANRPLVPAQLTYLGTLSQSIAGSAVAATGNKIVFAGGIPLQGCSTAGVDIYDIATGAWTTAQLSQARNNIGVAVLGNKIFFAGGFVPGQPNCWISGESQMSSVVDIYDVSSNTWSIDHLSSPRCPIGISAGNKVVFAGGDYFWPSDRVDIYDASTNSWSASLLSSGRRILSATSIGNKIFFAGGDYYIDGIVSNIDIYDISSNTWAVSFFSPPFDQGWAPGGIAAGGKNYWAGGQYYSPATYIQTTDHVEIRDANTNASTFDCLSEPRSGVIAVKKDNKICFFGEDNTFDIFDLATHAWSIGVLPQNNSNVSIISYNNVIYVRYGNQVWKLEL